MWNFHDLEIFTFERRTFSVTHAFSMTVHCQLCCIWLMMRGYYLLLFAKGCRDILFVLRLLPATDTPPGKWVTQMYLPQKYLLPCAVWTSVRWGVCAVQVLGVHPQRPPPAWHRKRGSAPPALQGTGAELKSSEELFSSEIRSKMELGFLIYCVTGFPFQTWFVKTTEGHIRCISWKLAAYFLASLLSWDD